MARKDLDRNTTTTTTAATTRRLWFLALTIGLVSPILQLRSWYMFVLPSLSSVFLLAGEEGAEEQAIIAPTTRRNDNGSLVFQGAGEDIASLSPPPAAQVTAGAVAAANEEDVEIVEKAGGAFIHVGKTGGSTLTRYLRNACHSYIPKPCGGVLPRNNETLVSKLITDYYHVPDFFRLPRQQHSFYLISLRDPLDRTISAFVNNHPTNSKILDFEGSYQLYWKRKRKGYFDAKCFETLQEFVDNIGDSPNDFVYENTLPIHMKRDNCTNFCRAVLHSKVKRFIHLFWSYEKLVSLLPTTSTSTTSNNATTTSTTINNNNSTTTTTTTTTTSGTNFQNTLDHLTIYATRKEYLLDDFQRINHHLKLYHGQGNNVTTNEDEVVAVALANNNNNNNNVRDVSNISLPIKRDLSTLGRKRLCIALSEEYRIYLELIFNAKNFNQQDIINSLQYSRKQCPSLTILSQDYWKDRLLKLEKSSST